MTHFSSSFRYDFDKYKDILQIPEGEGIIQANQVLFQKWTFKPPEIGYYFLKIQCFICPISSFIFKVKYTRSFFINIQGEASSSELVVS